MSRAALALALLGLALGGAPAGLAQEPAPQAASAAQVDRLDLRDASVGDALRLVAEAAGLNVAATPAASSRRVSLVLQGVPVNRAVEALCKVSGLWFREEAGILRVMTAEEYRADIVVQRDAKVEVFTLLQPNGLAVAQAVKDVFGERVHLSFGVADQLQLSGLLGGSQGQGQNQGQNPQGLGNGQTSFGGSGSSPFTTSFGASQGLFGGQQGQGQGQALTRKDEEEAARLAPELTAEQLSRLQVDAAGRATGGTEGLTLAEPPITVSLSRRHNVIVVRTSDDGALRQIGALIRDLDRPTPQVLLEVKILEVTLDDGRQTALDVDWVDGPPTANLPTGKPANPLDLTQGAGLEQVAGAGNLPLIGGTLVYQYLNDHVRVRLQALETEGRLAVLSTPLLLCANNEAARVFVGEERPLVRSFQLQTLTTNGVVQSQLVPQIDLRDIGNSLRMIPLINADRTVTLTLVQDVSSVNVGGARIPVPSGDAGGVQLLDIDTVNTANLQGTVVAQDGLTLAVGGLIRKSMRDRQTGIPWLMELPFVGWLFGSHERAEEQREIVLLITPHVLLTPSETAQRSRARLDELSIHPYNDIGDRALNRYERSDVPGAEDHRLLIDDWLLPAPQPLR